MYATKAENPLNPSGSWGTPVLLLDSVWEGNAFNGAVLQHDEKIYLVWSNDTSKPDKLYMAPMTTPTKATTPVILVKQATEIWENNAAMAAAFSYSKSHSYLVYSTNTYGTSNYSLSYISIEFGRDPMLAFNWQQADGPIFSSNEAENVYGPGHASFTVSPDLQETWMVYWASSNASNVQGSNTTRIERIVWDDDSGEPIFPKPHGFNRPQPIPSSLATFVNPILAAESENPAVIYIAPFYFLSLSDNQGHEVKILKSGHLTSFQNAEQIVAYR